MKLENLKVGQIVKNYRELCKLLELKTTTGQAKQNQMAWIKEHIGYEKDGHKFIISNMTAESVKPPKDMRGGDNNPKLFKDYKGFFVGVEDFHSIGVYKIELGDEIYIGSTMVGFRSRFAQHSSKQTKATSHMFDCDDVRFTVIENCKGMNKKEIRLKENYWIEFYNEETKLKVLNRKNAVMMHDEENFKQSVQVTIKKSDYNEFMDMYEHFFT